MSLLARIQVGILFIVAENLKIPEMQTLAGAGVRAKVGEWCKDRGFKRALIITDKDIMKLGIADKLLSSLKKAGIPYFIYDGVLPNPTVNMSREAAAIGRSNNADVVIAFGGGSAIDCSKLAAAAVTNTKRVDKLVGFFKVRKTPLPIIAVPTTAGTGSEVSGGAVISDDLTHQKNIMISAKIVPILSVLDGETMIGLPPHLTASTGFDALTHAVEGYVGRHYNAEGKNYARDAVVIIHKYLKTAFKNGKNIEARDALALAAYKAGWTLNKCSAGYAHAFGHRLTGFYDVPHGLAVAMFLPHVLEMSKESAIKPLSELAIACGMGKASDAKGLLADKFVKWIFELYDELKLPKKCEKLKRSDYDLIIKEAFKEANATYAVPKYFSQKEAFELLDKILA